jgi:hypothetical protein
VNYTLESFSEVKKKLDAGKYSDGILKSMRA